MSIISLWGKVLQLYYSTSLLSNANVTGMEDIQRLFRETIAEFLEGSLDAEPEKHWVMGDTTILPEPNREQQTAETVIAGKP